MNRCQYCRRELGDKEFCSCSANVLLNPSPKQEDFTDSVPCPHPENKYIQLDLEERILVHTILTQESHRYGAVVKSIIAKLEEAFIR